MKIKVTKEITGDEVYFVTTLDPAPTTEIFKDFHVIAFHRFSLVYGIWLYHGETMEFNTDGTWRIYR